MLCFGQGNKSEINSLIKTLNSKLVSKGPSTEEKFTFSVNKDGLLQIERNLIAPKLVSRSFTYSFYLKDVEYFLDSQHHDGKTYYAFVFKNLKATKTIKQVLKVKKLNTALPETVETDSFVTLVIPVTLDITTDEIELASETISKIFGLAANESTYLSSVEH